LGGILDWAIALRLGEAGKEDRERHEALEHTTEDIREAVRNGEAGEAFKRLFPEDHAESLRQEDTGGIGTED
jgi:hypothetical protein